MSFPIDDEPRCGCFWTCFISTEVEPVRKATDAKVKRAYSNRKVGSMEFDKYLQDKVKKDNVKDK